MKTFALVIFTLVLLSLPIEALAQGTGCGSGKRAEGIYYTDCYPWVVGDGYQSDGTTHDDTPRLQAAINAAAGQRLIFNENVYHVKGTLTLQSHSVLEGLTPATGYLDLRVFQHADSSVLFAVGEGIYDIAIRDLGFRWVRIGEGSSTPSNAVFFKAEGDPGDLSSNAILFEHLRIRNFTKGIYVNSTGAGGWQFDNNQLKDTTFEECALGIHLNAINTGWNMNNVGFASLAGQSAIYVQKAGYLNMNFIVGNGFYSQGVPAANECIRIEGHGFVNINNANCEAYKKALIIDTPNSVKGTPVVLENSDFQECHWNDNGTTKPSVVFNNATVISTGNQYACLNTVARPSVEGMAEVYSTGDRFCYEGTAQCFSSASPFAETSRSGWAVKGWGALLRTDSSNEYNGTDYDMTKAFVDITSTYSNTEGAFKPFMSLTSSFYDGGLNTWLKYRYTLTRSNTNSRLEFNGDLNGSGSPTVVGYHFKGGPVQLQTATATQVNGGTYNSYAGGDAGSMLYCSDCTANTNPCTGSGGGALAIKVASGNWACK